MPRRTRILTWNGKDVPTELRDLPVGRYVVEAVEDEAPALTPEEEAGIEAALESYRQGRVVDANGCHLTSAGISGQYNCRLSTPLPFADPKAPGAPITTSERIWTR